MLLQKATVGPLLPYLAAEIVFSRCDRGSLLLCWQTPCEDQSRMTRTARPAGYLTFTLHAHLPYVVNHGTWPHGIEWLHEAAAETYLPLLRAMRRLAEDGLSLFANINLSPILLEQLAHPVFQADFPRYVERKIASAREDEAFFKQAGETHYASVARYWQAFYTDALHDFGHLDQDIVRGFRDLNTTGSIDVLTCSATHGYNPLLGTDESVRAQIRTAVQTHRRHFGRHPRGIWLPECGYRPAGFWNFPVAGAGEQKPYPGLFRIGVDQAVSESGLQFFFVDTHLVEEAEPAHSPYGSSWQSSSISGALAQAAASTTAEERDDSLLYFPHTVEGSYDRHFATSVFPRDPRTGLQVWSGDSGYPGDPVYLDFHKKRWPGGHRYWQVTGAGVGMAGKIAYHPETAAERTQEHAKHFVHLVREALSQAASADAPPILCAPFDAELFGHWWFEGVLFLENVVRELASGRDGLHLTTCASYLDRYPKGESISMHEGSWGAGGDNQVWLGPDTAWTYTYLYPAELYTREVCTHGEWRDGALGERILKQLCRELLLLESSDWQFLITTGAARDYAEKRFHTHHEQFQQCRRCWEHFEVQGELTPELLDMLTYIEERDSVFADINPEFWVFGAKETDRSLPSHPSAAK